MILRNQCKGIFGKVKLDVHKIVNFFLYLNPKNLASFLLLIIESGMVVHKKLES